MFLALILVTCICSVSINTPVYMEYRLFFSDPNAKITCAWFDAPVGGELVSVGVVSPPHPTLFGASYASCSNSFVSTTPGVFYRRLDAYINDDLAVFRTNFYSISGPRAYLPAIFRN